MKKHVLDFLVGVVGCVLFIGLFYIGVEILGRMLGIKPSSPVMVQMQLECAIEKEIVAGSNTHFVLHITLPPDWKDRVETNQQQEVRP